MKKLAIEILNKELEFEKRIEELKLENKRLLEENKNIANNTLKLGLSKCLKYCSISDFCRITKNILFIKETELKQWMEQKGYLIIHEDKYVPAEGKDTCILVDNELYVKYEFMRKQLMFLRTMIYIDDFVEVKAMVKSFKENKESLVEQMGNTVYIGYKRGSNEFRSCRDNKFFIGGNEDRDSIK